MNTSTKTPARKTPPASSKNPASKTSGSKAPAPASSKKPAVSYHVKLQGRLSGLILAARNRRKLSQLEAARLLSLKGADKTVQSIVSAWERGWRRVVLENDAQHSGLSNLLGVTPVELERLIQEDKLARQRATARRAARKAVLRQYRLDSKANTSAKEVPAPETEVPVPPVVSDSEKPEPARKLPSEKVREAVLLTLLAGESELSTSPSTIQAVMRVIHRFNQVCETLAGK